MPASRRRLGHGALLAGRLVVPIVRCLTRSGRFGHLGSGMQRVFGPRARTLSRSSELIVSKPTASSPQTALADVEQRIVAAAREREESAGDSVAAPSR